MKKEKKLKINIKYVFLLLLVILIFAILLFIICFNKKEKYYDFDKMETFINKEYSQLNLVKMDDIDVLTDFGFSFEDVDNHLFMKSKYLDEEFNEIKSLDNLSYVIYIQDSNYLSYYDDLFAYIDSNKNNLDENSKDFKLFDKAILEYDSKNNLVYMILGNKPKDLKKDLDEYLILK